MRLVASPAVAASRSDQVAAFYALYARGLERTVARRVAGAEMAKDGCAFAWEKLLERPDIDLNHRGRKWLETTAIRWGWNEAGHDAKSDRLDSAPQVQSAGYVDGRETVGGRLVGVDDGTQARIEARERLELVGELSPDQQRALRLLADGFSYDEISAATGSTFTKVNHDLTRGRAKLRELDAAGPTAALRDPRSLLKVAREQHTALVLERAGAPTEVHEVLDKRLGNVTAAVRALSAELIEREAAQPSAWAVELLGDRPADPAMAGLYDRAVREAARYRVAYDVRDNESGLGGQPMRQTQRAAFQRAYVAVREAQHALGRSMMLPSGQVGKNRGAATVVPRGQLSFDPAGRRDVEAGR